MIGVYVYYNLMKEPGNKVTTVEPEGGGQGWRSEILAGIKFGVEPKITIAGILADLNLAVRYRITIRIYVSYM